MAVSTKVYQKGTHMGQYLNFGSNYALEHKQWVVKTLVNHIYMLVSKDTENEKESEHVNSALGINRYPDWILHTQKTNKRPLGGEQRLQ